MWDVAGRFSRMLVVISYNRFDIISYHFFINQRAHPRNRSTTDVWIGMQIHLWCTYWHPLVFCWNLTSWTLKYHERWIHSPHCSITSRTAQRSRGSLTKRTHHMCDALSLVPQVWCLHYGAFIIVWCLYLQRLFYLAPVFLIVNFPIIPVAPYHARSQLHMLSWGRFPATKAEWPFDAALPNDQGPLFGPSTGLCS